MSKKRIVEIVEDSGINYGQISHPNDLVLAQSFAHQHTENATKDYLQSPTAEVADCGFGFSGMTFSIGEGRIYKAGKQYDVSFSSVNLAAANGTHPRIDLIVATLGDDVPSGTQFVAFQRIRTSIEIGANAPPYPQTQFERSTELRNVGVVSVKTGTPAASPVAPTLGANEVALCRITVPAGGTNIASGWLSDQRNVVSNLGIVKGEVDVLQEQMITALNYENQPRNFLSSFQRVATLTNILEEIAQGLLVLKYRYPTIATSDGYIPANVVSESGQWVLDIPIGTFVQFGDRYVAIIPENFVDPTLNARYATASDPDDIKYTHIFDNQSEIEDSLQNTNSNPTANVVRFNIPTGPIVKALNLNRDGELTLTDAITPSNGSHCLLLKITSPDSVTQPTLKKYYNVRNGIIGYSGTYNAASPATKQFSWKAGTPPGVGYLEYFAIKASDKTHYEIDGLSIPPTSFDQTITLSGITDGDQWVVRHTILSTI